MSAKHQLRLAIAVLLNILEVIGLNALRCGRIVITRPAGFADVVTQGDEEESQGRQTLLAIDQQPTRKAGGTVDRRDIDNRTQEWPRAPF